MKKAIYILSFLISVQLFIFLQTASAEGQWTREISLGYNQANGNTTNSQLNFNTLISRKSDQNDFSSTFDVFYSSTNKKMDAKKWSSLTRYAYNFGEKNKWFNSYQLDISHDRFADIDYRFLPATGLGYWFSREESWEWLAESSLGYEITDYRGSQTDDESIAVIGRTYFKKQIWESAKISEDISIIPSLERGGTRIKSSTIFTNPLKEGLDLSIKYVVDFDSDPSAGKKKTDTQLITGIKYSF